MLIYAIGAVIVWVAVNIFFWKLSFDIDKEIREEMREYGYYNDCNGVKWLYVVYKNIVGYASSKYLSK